MESAVKYISVVVLYVIFSAAACGAGLLGLLGLAAGNTHYISNICKAMDKLLAAMLGWDGASTVSRECGKSSCRFCRILCPVLSWALREDHCAKEAA